MKKSTRILLIIVLSLALIVISVPKWFSFNSYNYDNAGRYTAGGSVIAQKVERIAVDWIAGEVTIEQHSGDEIILSETASRKLKQQEQVHWLVDGDTLYVKYVRAGRNYSTRLDKELTLVLPDSLNLEEIVISGVSADIQADLSDAERVCVQNVSGDTHMILGRTGALRVENVSGNVTLSCQNVPGSIDVNTVSGHATVLLPETAEFTATLDSVSGRIGGQLLEGVADAESFTRGNGGCDIHMNSVSGSLQLDACER